MSFGYLNNEEIVYNGNFYTGRKNLGFIGGLLAYRGWNIDKTPKRHFLIRNRVD
jgi:hypothetical protein